MLPLGAVVALAAVVRFATLDVQSFWLDEAITVRLVRLGFGDMLGEIPDSESTPPLYYALAWGWSRVFGDGEVGLRSLSALLGTLSVPVIYAIGARLVSRRAGLVAAALAAVNPMLVWYSQEARAYALLVLLGALSILLFLRAREEASAGRLAAWAVISALALASHYFAGFLVLAEAVWLAAVCRPRLRVAVAIAGVLAVALALLPIALDQRSHGGAAFIAESALGTRVAQVAKQFLVGFDAPAEAALTALAALLCAAAALSAIALGNDRERDGALPVAVLAAAALALPFVLSLAGADYLITRNMLAALVPVLILVGIGFAVRRAGAWGMAGAAALAGVFLATVVAVDVEPRFRRDDWRSAAKALEEASGRQAIVVTPGSAAPPLELYLPGVRALPAAGAPVNEVDVLGMAIRQPGEALSPPRPPSAPAAPAPGFELVDARRADTFTLLRYRAPGAPRPVEPEALAAVRLDPGPATVLLEP